MSLTNKKNLIEYIDSSLEAKDMIERMKIEVNNFFDNFSDNPKKRSEWGHHYFCKEDGHVLEYNPLNPEYHMCPICKTKYSSPLLEGVWVCIYRNEAAITILKAAILYVITDEKRYLDIVIGLTSFYIYHYNEFELHNKEGFVFESIDSMKWGCGRIMPQNLNESIFFIRIFTALELVKNEIPKGLMDFIKMDFSSSIFNLLNPQVDKIHNISCWMNSAIGVIGLFCDKKELIEYSFDGKYNINRQLLEGVTKDGFWYEGSIHYNFFTLEGIAYLALFAKTYDMKFARIDVVEKMMLAAYHYAFTNQQLPNPNDGWPDINLKSYSYIYAIGTKVFGETSEVGAIFSEILLGDYKRVEIPLSKPYYYNDNLSLEQLMLLPSFKFSKPTHYNNTSMDFEHSNYALLKGSLWNVFYKYGHHGPSHAHPDKMTIEVMIGQETLTRDLSNSGYGSIICNEWHRISASHNTIVVDGKNHTSCEPGMKIVFDHNFCDAMAEDVYPDVNFRRSIQLINDGFRDNFEVVSNTKHTYDYMFHVEAVLNMNLLECYRLDNNETLGYSDNGYSYFKNIKRIKPFDSSDEFMTLKWKLGEYNLISTINITNTEVFLAESPANPVTKCRTSIILRRKDKKTTFQVNWKLTEEENQ